MIRHEEEILHCERGEALAQVHRMFGVVRDLCGSLSGLPREAVAAPSLAVFKARLDGALSTVVWWKGSLAMAGGLD